MTKPRRITIKEIAKEAGVSMQTVSRVLNNRPDVATETRRRVKSIIAAHNYQPSSIARGITQGRSYILGVISEGLHYYGPGGMLMGVEKHASALGYTIILRVVHDMDQFDIDEQLNFFMSQHVDGLVWTLPEIDDLRELAIQKVPQLQIPNLFLNMRPHPDLMILDFDNRLGARSAVEHLLDQGARTIGLITGPLPWLSAHQRYLGWQDALQTAQRPMGEDLIVHGDWSSISGQRAMQQLLQQRPDIDAVFVSNDHMAMGAMKAARQANRHIPDDILMAGYDNIPEADFIHPALTTITNDFESLSSFAVKKLDRLITASQHDEELNEPKANLFEPNLIIRESSIRP